MSRSLEERHSLALRAGALGRRAVAIVVCALAVHAVVFASLWPSDTGHSYFGWYAPLVAGLSGISLVGLPLALAVALLSGHESRLVRATSAFLPMRTAEPHAAQEIVNLAVRATVFLVAQESFEHSLSSRRFELASFEPRGWLVVVVAVAAAAAVVVFIERAISSLVEAIRTAGRWTTRRPLRDRWPAGSEVGHRLRPLAVHGGLRAPPLPSS